MACGKKSTIHSKRDMALMSMAEYEKNPMILGGVINYNFSGKCSVFKGAGTA